MENHSRPPPVTGYPAPNPNNHPPPNTAYPYSAPVPNSHPYNYPPQPYPNRRATFLRSFIVAAVAVFVIFGFAFLIFWLVVRPRVPEFQLTSLSVSNFSVNQSQVTGNWDARLEAYNPNKKMSVSYDDVVSYVYYNSQFLTRTQISPFRQDTRDRTELTAKFSAVDSYVDRKKADDMNAERARGTVGFDVSLDAIAGFKYGGWRKRRRVVRVWCNDVPVSVSSGNGSGSLVGGARKCRVIAFHCQSALGERTNFSRFVADGLLAKVRNGQPQEIVFVVSGSFRKNGIEYLASLKHAFVLLDQYSMINKSSALS